LRAGTGAASRRLGATRPRCPKGNILLLSVALDYLSTSGDTREAALESTREAIVGYLEAAAKDGIPLPRSGLEPSIVEIEVALP
jgi:predicted RNase H-like HicB family nuclease